MNLIPFFPYLVMYFKIININKINFIYVLHINDILKKNKKSNVLAKLKQERSNIKLIISCL